MPNRGAETVETEPGGPVGKSVARDGEVRKKLGNHEKQNNGKSFFVNVSIS